MCEVFTNSTIVCLNDSWYITHEFNYQIRLSCFNDMNSKWNNNDINLLVLIFEIKTKFNMVSYWIHPDGHCEIYINQSSINLHDKTAVRSVCGLFATIQSSVIDLSNICVDLFRDYSIKLYNEDDLFLIDILCYGYRKKC